MKNPPAMQETQVQSLGWEVTVERGMATTPVYLLGEFHRQRSLAGYIQFMLVAKSWTQLSDQPYITRVPPPTALSLDVFGCRISFFGRFQSFLLVTVQQLAVILVCS